MAEGKGKLSAVLNFGARVAPTLGKATDEITKRLGNTTKAIGKLEAAQKKAYREMVRTPPGAALDKLRTQYRRLGSQIDETRGKAERMRRTLDARQRIRGAVGSAGRSIMSGAGSVVSGGIAALGAAGAAAGAAGLAAGAGIVSLATDTAHASRELTHLSRRLGMSTQSIQGLTFAAEQNGTTFETVTDGFKTLNEKIAEAMRDRNGGAADLFKRIGVSASAMASMLPEEQLAAMADVLAQTSNQAERTRIATELLGGSGDRLLPMLEGGRAGLAQMRGEAERLGLVWSDGRVAGGAAAARTFDQLKATLGGIAATIGSAALPALTRMADGLRTSLASQNTGELVRKLGTAFERIGQSLTEHGPRMIEVGVKLATGFADAVPLVVDLAEKALELVEAVGGVETVGKAVGAMWGVAFGISAVGKVSSMVGAVRTVIDAVGGASGLKTALLSFASAGRGAIGLVTGALRVMTAAALANPFIALATVAILVIANWETVKKWFVDFFNFIESKMTALGSGIARMMGKSDEEAASIGGAAWEATSNAIPGVGLYRAARDRLSGIGGESARAERSSSRTVTDNRQVHVTVNATSTDPEGIAREVQQSQDRAMSTDLSGSYAYSGGT